MDRVTVNGIHLEYTVSGTGEPVVFIHGALIAETFGPLASDADLASRYRCIQYHRRGYAGSSRVNEPASISTQVADCLALLRHLGVERTHVTGHSYGGVVALQMAMDAPKMVHTVAVLEPALAVGASGPAYRESLAGGSRRFREMDTATLVDEFLRARWPEYRPTLDRMLPGAFDLAVTDAATSFEYEVSGLLDWHFGEAEARRVSQPVLSVLGGESDAHSPRFGETHRLLLEWLPDAEGFILPGTTHFLQIQDPHGMARALTSFWSRHPLT